MRETHGFLANNSLDVFPLRHDHVPLLGVAGPQRRAAMIDGRGCDCVDALTKTLGAPVLMSFGDLVAECPWCGARDVDPEAADLRANVAVPSGG